MNTKDEKTTKKNENNNKVSSENPFRGRRRPRTTREAPEKQQVSLCEEKTDSFTGTYPGARGAVSDGIHGDLGVNVNAIEEEKTNNGKNEMLKKKDEKKAAIVTHRRSATPQTISPHHPAN